ncbi:BamA/TamA family outer membrane protein [Aureispira]|nr:BamA/TamA family outer membrane protein [Aureispira sp.]
MVYRLFCCLLFLCCSYLSTAQITKVCIKTIAVEGHKKTQTKLIKNELSFQEGDSLLLKDLMPTIDKNKQFLINTLLFNHVTIKISKWDGRNVHVLISLKESWYIFPFPQFELADRNFNVWWTRHNRNFQRANVGLWLIWRNLTGYNDLLKLVVQFGYTRKFELDYTLPPMGRNRKFGFNVNALYSDNKELAFNTINNKLAFYSNYDITDRQFQRIRARLRGYYRRTLYETQKLELDFLQLSISDSIASFNPDFFLDGKLTQKSFNLKYTYILDKRDIRAYPLKGYYFNATLYKEGLGIFNDINQLQLTANFSHFMPIGKRLSIANTIKGRYSFIRSKTSYYNNRALGYKDNYVRGFQYYVINGQDYVIIQTDINIKVFDFTIPMFKKAPINYLKGIPIKIHLRYHLDFGYVWDKYYINLNKLGNSDLVGTGIGIDLIFYTYNIIFQFEYTFNNNGEKGLYLRYKFNF